MSKDFRGAVSVVITVPRIVSVCGGGRFIVERVREFVDDDRWTTAKHNVIHGNRLGDLSATDLHWTPQNLTF